MLTDSSKLAAGRQTSAHDVSQIFSGPETGRPGNEAYDQERNNKSFLFILCRRGEASRVKSSRAGPGRSVSHSIGRLCGRRVTSRPCLLGL